jgi:hypothetical protein
MGSFVDLYQIYTLPSITITRRDKGTSAETQTTGILKAVEGGLGTEIKPLVEYDVCNLSF